MAYYIFAPMLPFERNSNLKRVFDSNSCVFVKNLSGFIEIKKTQNTILADNIIIVT